MEYIEYKENRNNQNSFGEYYAIYFPKTKEYIIVEDHLEADELRKGNYNLTQKFTTKEEAINWAENCKIENFVEANAKKFYGIYFRDTSESLILTSPEEVSMAIYKRSTYCRKFLSKEKALEWIKQIKECGKDVIKKTSKVNEKKKKYYGIYFINTRKEIILDSSIDVMQTVKNSPTYCRKFDSEEKALEWLKIVKKTGKNIEPNTVKAYQNMPDSQIVSQRYYGVYLIESQKSFVTNLIEEANLAIKKEKGLIKKFRKKQDAINWTIECENSKRIYCAIFFTDELKGIITFNYEMRELFIKDKPNIIRAFGTIMEADKWLKNLEHFYRKEMEKLLKEDTIFFDVGTGRGIGEEVRVSDFEGNSLLNKLEEYTGLINQYGNYNLGKINNTNYGELYGLYLALLIALRNNIYKIAGDSKTVINQWSKGEIILSKILPYEQELIYKVIDLRKEFETKGGEVCYINASLNPADLGFHKNKRKVKVIEEVDNS